MYAYTLLVADDEEIECNGITKVIMECFPQITVVDNVYDGVGLLRSARKYHPDMIIADINMPGMNGLEAIEQLQHEKINSKIIINTAYSYFEYAKKAIILKAADYLLKPIDKDSFCKTIEKVLKMIDQEREKNFYDMKETQAFQKMLGVAGKEILSSVVMGKPKSEELNAWLENMGHTYWGGFFVVGKCKQDLCSEETLQEIYTLVREKQEINSVSLVKVFREMLICFFFPEEKIGEDNYKEWIKIYLDRFIEEIREKFKCEMYFGVGNWRYDFEEMHQSYIEAISAVEKYEDNKTVIFQNVKQIKKQAHISLKNMKKLVEYVKIQQIESCTDLLKEQLKLWKEVEMTSEERDIMLTLLLQECSRKVCGYNIYSWNQVKMITSQKQADLGEMITYLLYNLDALRDLDNSRNSYVMKSLVYIKEHFTENISLEMAAESMGISSFYLSRLLTQQIQSSFVELLTSERINRAIELICTKEKQVRNIGLKCGYQSAAYFYKVFKKNTGVTVGEMREFLGRQK